jgi:hypothetical protein
VAKKKLVESDMYPYIKDFFRKSYKCKDVVADLPDDPYLVRVPKNLRNREIDVVAVRETPNEVIVHLAEGKTFEKSHSFAEAVNQLEDVSEFGHFLWVFFPAKKWALLPHAEREADEKKLGTKGFGLLLVDGKEVIEELTARPQKPTPDKIGEVLRCMGKIRRECLPVLDALDANHRHLASRASATGAVAATLVAAALRRAGLGKVTINQWELDFDDVDLDEWCDWFYLNDVELDIPEISIQTDPFGVHLRDGRAVLWVWSDTSEQRLEEYVRRPVHPFGTHVYAQDSVYGWQWQIQVLADVDATAVRRIVARGFGTLLIGHRLELSGRSAARLGDEAVAAVKQAKKLKLWK